MRAFDYPSLWRQYSADPKPYDPSRAKAAMVYFIPMRHMQKVMAHSFILAGQSKGMVGYWSFFYIHCMPASISMHLEHGLLLFLLYQALLKAGEGYIYADPYITRLLRGLHMSHTIPHRLEAC